MADKIVENFDNPRQFLATAGAGRSIESYESGQPVFRQGDAADAVFYIQTGKIQIAVVSEQGKEGVVAVLDAIEFFGEGCLAGQPLQLATASALTRSKVTRITKQTMVGLIRDQPSFSQFFMAFLLSRNIAIEADLVDQLFNSSEKRLARVLLMLANYGKDGKMEPVIPHISQDMLAARVGTTRSRVNFFMNKFRNLGLIEYNGGLKVHSSLLNVIVHD
jgi:CRP-like cAMP-binding protein